MWFQWVLLAAVLAAAWVSRGTPRCLTWLGLGALCFVGSKVLVASGISGQGLYLANAMLDALVALAIACNRRYDWERRLYYIVVSMIVVHVLAAGSIIPRVFPETWGIVAGEPVYATALELLNLAAISVIGWYGWEAARYDRTAPDHSHRLSPHLARHHQPPARGWGSWQ